MVMLQLAVVYTRAAAEASAERGAQWAIWLAAHTRVPPTRGTAGPDDTLGINFGAAEVLHGSERVRRQVSTRPQQTGVITAQHETTHGASEAPATVGCLRSVQEHPGQCSSGTNV